MKNTLISNYQNCKKDTIFITLVKRIWTVKISQEFLAQYHTSPVISTCKILVNFSKVSVWGETPKYRRDITPVHSQWSYVSFAISHWQSVIDLCQNLVQQMAGFPTVPNYYWPNVDLLWSGHLKTQIPWISYSKIYNIHSYIFNWKFLLEKCPQLCSGFNGLAIFES